MFTGIIKQLGTIRSVAHSQNNVILEIESDLAKDLSIDQSVAHNGICLTVESISEEAYHVIAIEETLRKTTLSDWQVGQVINLETAMNASKLLDGHIVQGHIDGVATILKLEDEGGSIKYTIQYPEEGIGLIVEKGSVTLDGVSLTCFEVSKESFCVAIIPYTKEHTCIQYWKPKTRINIEFDILGKLVQKQLEAHLNQITPEK